MNCKRWEILLLLSCCAIKPKLTENIQKSLTHLIPNNIFTSGRTLGGFSSCFPVSSCLPWKRTLFWTELPIRGQTGEGTGWVTKQKIAGFNFQNNIRIWFHWRFLNINHLKRDFPKKSVGTESGPLELKTMFCNITNG